MMKGTTKNLLCVLLALVIALSALSAVGFSAAQTDEAQTAENVTVEETAPADADLAQTAVEPEPATEAPAQEPTEAPAQEPTEAPTEAPTEPTVGKVKNISRDSYESDSCLLNWDAVDGATGYYIYYLNADNHKNFSKVGDVKGNSCVVKNLRQGTQYHFKISAYIEYDGRIIEGETTLKKTATQPAKVTGLTKWRSSTVLEMEWDRNDKATGYRIYRTEGSGKEVLYKTLRGSSNTTYTESGVKGGRIYKYRVKAFRELYDTSYSSEAATMTFMGGLCGPDYSITSRLGRVNLSWNANPYATHYEVFMSDSANNASFKKLYTTPRLYYNTSKLTVGKTYYFRIRPIYKSGSTLIEGTSNKKSQKITDRAYGDYVGSTYIEISIDQQHMWVYKNGSQIASTDVVTGNKGSADTPKGYYSVRSKSRNIYLSGDGYSSFVEYWMAFIGSSYGIHDASWRSEFGNPIYKGNGSHGCVNTPYSAVKTIYNNISVGTPVIIY
ncbi:MAG: L,D-transpeptidase family protein [Ruminococcus sp.]|nr:L,D-transpeptidase family protein [Ruminococcus sp.]